jgi:hypothetical protein
MDVLDSRRFSSAFEIPELIFEGTRSLDRQESPQPIGIIPEFMSKEAHALPNKAKVPGSFTSEAENHGV